MNRPIRLANTFSELAWPFLSDLEFRLDNDPNQVGQYMATRADYRLENGFFLSVGFNPLDGGTAGIMCGRAWNYRSKIPALREFRRFSHHYDVLAAKFGFELPRAYPLDVNDEENADLLSILDDLQNSLPGILARLTLTDLIAIEREEHGAQWFHEQSRRDHFAAGIRFAGITPFTTSQTAG